MVQPGDRAVNASEPTPAEGSTLVADALSLVFGRRLRTNEPLAKHTSWRVGGPAALFAVAEAVAEVRAALTACREAGLEWFAIGKGTNLLISDEGFPGLVLQLGSGFRKWSVQGVRLEAGAAMPLTQIVQVAERHGLGGLSFAVAIPGSLGGAIVTNAGAHGGSLGDVVHSVTLVTGDGELRTVTGDEIDFGYRHSGLDGQGVILEAILDLTAAGLPRLRGEMSRYFKQRKLTQPRGAPSAGSVFKNPPGGFAGEMIEEAGLKGRQHGGAKVSEKHANFIVVSGPAGAADIYALMREIQSEVSARFGVVLEPEVRLLGRFEPPLMAPPSPGGA